MGDTPIIGAGTYADNAVGAISGTGQGEYFLRAVLAHDIAARVEHGGRSLADAARAADECQADGARRQGRRHRAGPGGAARRGFQHADDGAGSSLGADGAPDVALFDEVVPG